MTSPTDALALCRHAAVIMRRLRWHKIPENRACGIALAAAEDRVRTVEELWTAARLADMDIHNPLCDEIDRLAEAARRDLDALGVEP